MQLLLQLLSLVVALLQSDTGCVQLLTDMGVLCLKLLKLRTEVCACILLCCKTGSELPHLLLCLQKQLVGLEPAAYTRARQRSS